MKEALSLAASMAGRTSPDPMVGAVVVSNGRVISRGRHAEAGTPHAEAIAIKKAGRRAKGATLYLNLEPCSHYGNNPPCSDSILRSGIKKVVACMKDPNPLVSGRGFRKLREAGIKVEVGLFEEEAKKLNEYFIKYITKKRPFVILKSAMSLDGKISTRVGESEWISGEASRRLVHKMRNEVDAIMTGIGTVLTDDPRLTVRMIKGRTRNPLKIIIDPFARVPLKSNVLLNEPWKAIVVVSEQASKARASKIENLDASVIRMKARKGMIDLGKLMDVLGGMGIMSVMIETGGGLAASAIESDIVDKIMMFVAPKIIGGAAAPGPVGGGGVAKLASSKKLKDLKCSKIGEDVLIEAYLS